VCAVGELLGPLRQHSGEDAGVVVVTAERSVRADASGTKEHDRVSDLFAPQVVQRFQVFGQDPQRPAVRALHEFLIQVRDRAALPNLRR
jgi:hypothetical protein